MISIAKGSIDVASHFAKFCAIPACFGGLPMTVILSSSLTKLRKSWYLQERFLKSISSLRFLGRKHLRLLYFHRGRSFMMVSYPGEYFIRLRTFMGSSERKCASKNQLYAVQALQLVEQSCINILVVMCCVNDSMWGCWLKIRDYAESRSYIELIVSIIPNIWRA